LAGPPVYEPAPNPASRSVDRFSDAATDVVNARVYEGIHLRFADVEARKQGRHVAQWVFSHSLRSVDDDDHDDGEDEERSTRTASLRPHIDD